MTTQAQTDDDKVKEVTKLLSYLKQIRQPYESLINECIEYGYHSRRKINVGKRGGEKTGQTIYDSSAAQALELMGHGLYGNMLGPGWLKCTLPLPVAFPRLSIMQKYNGKKLDDIPEVAKWLADVQDVINASIQDSNFYQLAPQVFKDCACIGTVCMDSNYIIGQNRLSFSIPHIREVYIGRNQEGEVDTRIRVYDISLKDAKETFGNDKMNDAVPGWLQKYENNPYDKIEVIHAIFPRSVFNADMITADNMPFVSRWVYANKLLKESGYPRFPSIVWDWMRNSDEYYARSAVANALNDIVMAQSMGKTNILAGARLADPPYAMAETLRGRNYMGPGGRTYLQGGEQAPQPLDTGLRALPIAIEFQDRISKIISKWLYTDIFLMMYQAMIENHNLRQAQVYEMIGEKSMVIAPLTEGAEKGFLDKLVDIVFDAEYASDPDGLPTGRIPMPPQIVLDIASQVPLKIEVDYQGQLSLARKMYYKTRGINAAVQGIAMMAEIAPIVVKVPKWINIAKKLLKDSLSPDDINTDEEIQAQIDAENAAMAEQNALAAAAGMADAVPKLSKPVEKGSLLSLVAGGE